jgi:hypothetical protein
MMCFPAQRSKFASQASTVREEFEVVVCLAVLGLLRVCLIPSAPVFVRLVSSVTGHPAQLCSTIVD